ncbi:MAG: hypothetical protein R3185_09340 [Candidatus Thermoplasmatota archaeon]|nr:hypothetical protein [Candidatus Thermoplasmatota archaeon]
MDARWRGVLAFGVGLVVFLLLIAWELVLAPESFSVNPDLLLWAGGVLAALAGAGVMARSKDPSTSQAFLGAGFGAGAFALALVIVQAMTLLGPVHPYHPDIEAQVGFNGTWDHAVAGQALASHGLTLLGNDELAGVTARGELAGMDAYVRLDRAQVPLEGNASIRLIVFFGPDGGMGSAEEARAWMLAHRTAAEAAFDDLASHIEEETGWQPVGEPRYQEEMAVN